MSAAKSSPTLCNPMNCSTPGFPVLHYLPEFAQTHVHWVSDGIQPSHPLLPPSFLAFYLSWHHGLFQWVSSSYKVTKVLEYCFSTSPSNEYSVLISFRNDWFDLLAVHRTPTPQFKSPNSLVLCLLYGSGLIPVSDCWKNIALTIWTFVGKVMSLLFNALFRCVIAFLPRSKCLLISWLQSMPTVILEPKKMKSDTVSIFPPFYLPRSDRTGCHDLHFFFFECWF